MLKRSLYMCLWMTLITGIAYPLLITFIAQLTMPVQANGSLITVNKKIVGSHFIGQQFTSDKYFWGRPSASNYDALHSGGSNLGLISAKLKEQVQMRKAHLKQTNPSDGSLPFPTELLFASGSGLDPHITFQTGQYQKMRIAKARGFNDKQTQQLENLIDYMKENRTFKLIGHPFLNVLRLNIALDKLDNSLVKTPHPQLKDNMSKEHQSHE